MSTQPKALRLADALDAEFVQGRISNSTGRESAVELRRLALKQWVGLTDEVADALEELDAQFSHTGLCGEAAAELRRLALKQWVGLTDEEIQDLGYLSQKIDASNSPWFDRWEFAHAIEQALREKNT